MIQSVLVASWRLTWEPAVLLLTAVMTLGFRLVAEVFGAGAGYWILPPDSMIWLAIAVSVRFWIGISVAATALLILRTDGRVRRPCWVSPSLALEAGLVALVLMLPILAGILFFIVPGVLLALRWSQVALLIVDGRARWFEAPGLSDLVTGGRRHELFTLWIIVGIGGAVLAWLVGGVADMAQAAFGGLGVATVVELAATVAANAFGLALVAATYFELVPTVDEL